MATAPSFLPTEGGISMVFSRLVAELVLAERCNVRRKLNFFFSELTAAAVAVKLNLVRSLCYSQTGL